MVKRRLDEDEYDDDLSVPLPIQTFLWRQTSPFIRPKFGKLHEASCMEQREACKSFEKVLVQNIQFGLSPSLTEAIRSISRWRLVRASFPHVMHCCAALLYRRRDRCLDKLGTAETKLLYTLHWIILDAAEECADAEAEQGIFHSPKHYLFPISAIQLFIYLFAPLADFLKHSDFMTSFRLENGLKLWEALWQYKHPQVPCFTTLVLPKRNFLKARREKKNTTKFGDVFLGGAASQRPGRDQRTVSVESSDTSPALTVTSPASTGSSTSPREDEAESSKSPLKEVDHRNATVCEICQSVPTKSQEDTSVMKCKCGNVSFPPDQVEQKPADDQKRCPLTNGTGVKAEEVDASMATYLDVAVLRCLFISQWLEEGIYWALKYLFQRLKEIKETQCEETYPRKRSTSLPIPEIEISLYQSPEQKKKDCLENIFMVDTSYPLPTHHTSMHELHHSCLDGQSDKQKSKRMKIGDFKLFVEEKFRFSEKLLDKIGKDASHSSYPVDQEDRTVCRQYLIGTEIKSCLSSDTLDLQRPKSALAMLDHKHSQSEDTDTTDLIKVEMIRGRSMPSLHLSGEQHRLELTVPQVVRPLPPGPGLKKVPAYHTFSVPNPIITVTEHSPVASVQFFLNQESGDSPRDDNSPPSTPTPLCRQFTITRSHTDSNITYSSEDANEAPGSTHYITKDGEISIPVVLKAVHAVTLGYSTCSLRVCEMILNLLDLIMSFDILPKPVEKELAQTTDKPDSAILGPVSTPATDASSQNQSEKSKPASDKKSDELSLHHLFMDALLRVSKHLGCPHGCGEGHRSPTADLLRSQVLNALNRLYVSDAKQFRSFLRDMMTQRPLTEVIDFFHAFVGFCTESGTIISPIGQKRTSSGGSQESALRNSYANNFGAGFGGFGVKGPEGLLFASVFKVLVSRLVLSRKDLKSQENMALYCDVRQLMSYVRDNHGGLFRRVALSGLLDSAERPFKKDKNTIPTTRIVRHTKSVDHEDYRDPVYSPTVFVVDETALAKSTRKSFFKKRGVRKVPSSQSIVDEREDISSCPSPGPVQISSGLLRYDKTVIPRLSVSEDENSSLQPTPKHKGNRFPIVNWLKGDKLKQSDPSFPEDDVHFPRIPIEGLPEKLARGSSIINRTPKLVVKSSTLSKAKKRVEDHLNKFGFGRNKNKHGSFEEPLVDVPTLVTHYILNEEKKQGIKLQRLCCSFQNAFPYIWEMVGFLCVGFPVFRGSLSNTLICAANVAISSEDVIEMEYTPDISRRNSCDFDHGLKEGEFLVAKESRLVNVEAVKQGMLRFSFLMEACHPGTIPDPALLAAALDLKAPVVARAALYFECAHFVHRCNKGCWPTWMKLNLPVFRPSGPLANRGTPSGLRRTHILQKAAGRMFYQWAEAIGCRLEELLEKDSSEPSNTVAGDESKKRQLRLEDEEEDFLDEACVNSSGSDCPFPLKMAACQLLLEITAFMRETYQYLPHKSSRLSGRERQVFEPRSITANRRWSMALSSLGFSQNSAHSIVSLAEQQMHPMPIGERRISFFLHEADGDGESENSSNTTLTVQDEEEKRGRRIAQGRPHLLRRGPSSTGHNSSFKRRSIKLKKPGDRRSRARSSTFIEDDEDVLLKRTDSIHSRRKVSAISDRSDTSERAEVVSGEESPGVLSDDQLPESPVDVLENDDGTLTKYLPWLKVVVQVTSNLNYTCTHQYFCHFNCYRRQMRGCSRLVKAVRKVYGDSFGFLQDAEKQHEDKEDLKKEKKIKKIITAPSSPLRRKASVAHNLDKLERASDIPHLGAFRSLHSSTTFLAHDIEAGSHTEKPEMKIPPAVHLKEKSKSKEELPVLKYMKSQVKNLFHCTLSTAIKGAVVMPEDYYTDIMSVAWELLLETDHQLSATAAVAFILSSVKSPEQAAELLSRELKHEEPSRRISAVLKFQTLWRNRYQCWPRMEEGAHVTFKVPPPTIEFTLPSPKIALDCVPVADTPWMPHVKAKVEEVTINQDQTLQRSFVTATKTRRKQQMELVHKALEEEEEKKRTERENFHITTVAATAQAAYEPALFHAVEEHEEGDEDLPLERTTAHHMQAAQSLFPSCLCSAAIPIISLLEDSQVDSDGVAVYEAALKVTWLCLVEDSALFLRHILEKLTRERQHEMFQILRKLLRFLPQIPAQSAYTLYNYLIGYVMFYVRTPVEGGQDYIGNALSVLWQVVPNVHGLFLKDLKQILRKEQCDATLLITANVPSAKKIIIHGPDAGGIPSQYPIHEDTQFSLILQDSLDFFGIDEMHHNSYFLVDTKTNQIHNPDSFVRDFYFFKRSQYPQLSLIHMNADEAFETLQKQCLKLRFLELGKVLMSLSILKSNTQIAQRVFFLHEELMKLPSFPRKALEADFSLYIGPLGKEMLGMDTLHKTVWVRLISRMFEAMAGLFVHSSDVHLFLNVVNGALVLHSEDAAMLRLCMSTFLNAAHQFKNIFASNGYLLIMPTILRIYSNHQTNGLLCRTIEFVSKQFYIMHRKPFILQMFGSVASILDMDTLSNFGDASKVQPKAFFQLLQSLEQYVVDPLDILELVNAEKPLKALDFCYQMDPDTLTIPDAISLCITVVAYAADSQRGHQMLTILEAILPFYLRHLQNLTTKKETPGGSRTELIMIHNISVCMKTLISNCEALARNYTGPQRRIDLRGSSIKNISRGACSPPFEIDDDSHSKFMGDSYYSSRKQQQQQQYDRQAEDSDILRLEFRRPRDTLLHVVSEFLTKCSARLADISKKIPDVTSKATELLDVKCHLRLAEVAHSLLKVSPYDPMTMACHGLQRYINEVLPHSEWAQESMRPALIMVLRRIDKTFNKIAKKTAIRRLVDWNAARSLLKGVYRTLYRHPYIAHLPHLKSLVTVCQSIILGDQMSCSNAESVMNLPSSAAAMGQSPPPSFCSVVVRLIAMQMIALGESQSLEVVCGGSSAFSSPEKVEIYLMNLILPLCIRISSGIKEVPKLRHSDITFALTMVLHALAPVSPKQGHGGKGAMDSNLQEKTLSRSKMFLFHIGFVGLKILIVCFEKQLETEWHRISCCIQELGNGMQGGLGLWNFIDFIVTHRTPLYVLLYPLIKYKMLQTICNNEQEYIYQQRIKGKLQGFLLPTPKSYGHLYVDMVAELKFLKEDLITWKIGGADVEKLKATVSGDRSLGDVSQQAIFLNQSVINRRYESSGLFGHPNDRQNVPKTQSPPGLMFFRSSVRSSTPEPQTSVNEPDTANEPHPFKAHKGLSIRFKTRGSSRRVLKNLLRRSSYPYPQEEASSSQDILSSKAPAVSEPRLWRKSTFHIKRGSTKKDEDSGSNLASPIDSHVEGKEVQDYRGEPGTSAQPLSCPASPGSVQSPDHDAESHMPRHRLQRQKAPSSKAFRYRKSHRGAWSTRTDAEGGGETIAMVSTKKQPALTEEDGLAIAADSSLPEVGFLPKQKVISGEESPGETQTAVGQNGRKHFRSQSHSPTSTDNSPLPLSPTDACESTESISISEKSALLKGVDNQREGSQSSLLMVFPTKSGENTCV